VTTTENKGGSGALSRAQSRLVLALFRGAVLKATDTNPDHIRVSPGNEVLRLVTVESLLRRGFLVEKKPFDYQLSSKGKIWARERLWIRGRE